MIDHPTPRWSSSSRPHEVEVVHPPAFWPSGPEVYKPTVPSNLSGKARCLILCSPRNHSIDANKSIKDIADQVSHIVKGVIDFAEADYSKAAFIGLFLSAKKLYIVFDYDNPDHSDCRVIAFKVRQHIKPIFVPATEVHKRVKSWKSYPHIVWPLSLLKIVG
jgi:hypothetical protein